MKIQSKIEERDRLTEYEVDLRDEDERDTGYRQESDEDSERERIDVDFFREQVDEDDGFDEYEEEEEEEYLSDDFEADIHQWRDYHRWERRDRKKGRSSSRWDQVEGFEDADWSWKP